MGAIADTIVAYAQPLLDSTDGSPEQINRALAISQTCWNLALLPEEERNEFLAKIQPALNLADEQLVAFRHAVIDPMIQRHQEMFPRMHQRAPEQTPSRKTAQAHRGKYAGTGRNAACPCHSGLKYKRCCGRS
jgi:uncharacterized protein YecA (UPF0149 family)